MGQEALDGSILHSASIPRSRTGVDPSSQLLENRSPISIEQGLGSHIFLGHAPPKSWGVTYLAIGLNSHLPYA